MGIKKKLFLVMGIFVLVAFTISSVLAFQGIQAIFPMSAAIGLVSDSVTSNSENSFNQIYCSKSGSLNYFLKQQISWGRFEHEIFYEGTSYDGCIQVEEDSTAPWFGYLREFYCDGPTIKWEEYQCPNGCDIPNGVCKPINNDSYSCTDSDGGINYLLKGTVSYTSIGGSASITDICAKDIIGQAPQFQNDLYERQCKNGKDWTTQYTCPNGCENGACKTSIVTEEPYCSKSGSLNYFLKQQISWGRFEHEIFYEGTSYDGCIQVEEDSTAPWFGYLREFYCDGPTIKWEEYQCPNGCDIPNGVCKPIDNIDVTSPTVLITNPVDGAVYTNHRTSMTFNVNDVHLHSCWYSLNGGANKSTSCSNGINTISSITSIEGINTWRVYARDASNNIGSDKIIFTVNTSEIIINHPIDLIVINPKQGESLYCPMFLKAFSENATFMTYSLDGNTNISMTEGSNNEFVSGFFSISKGYHNVLFCASNAFNSTCVFVNFKVIEKSPKTKTTCADCNKVRVLPDYGASEELKKTIILQEDVLAKQKLTFWQRILEFFKNLFNFD